MDIVKVKEEVLRIDVKKMEAELRKRVKGEVRFDNGSRAAYATDSSNYRQVPIGVVIPKTREDIIATVEICHKYKAPILSRGGGTSLAGQCCNLAVIMDMSKYYNKVLHIDAVNQLVKIEPGIVLDSMKEETENKYGLTFGPDPATHTHCTLGGMMGNNSCGAHSVMSQIYGHGPRVSDNTERMTVLTYDGLILEVGPTTEEELERHIKEGGRKGEIYRKLKAMRDKYQEKILEKYPNIPRRVSGYNLDEMLPGKNFNVARMLVGTESTCVVILDATLKLMPKLKHKVLLLLGYKDVYTAGHNAPIAMKHGPIALEGIDDLLVKFIKKKGLNEKYLPLLPEGNSWLVVEFGGNTIEEANERAKGLMAELKLRGETTGMQLYDDPKEQKQVWKVREAGLGATAFVPGMKDAWEGWEDSAVPPDKVGDYLKDLRDLFNKYEYISTTYGHFGQGCIHCRINFDFFTKEGIEKYKRFTREAAQLVIRYGGSLSGEHGDGQSRGDLLEIMYGKELIQAFHEFKSIWDPEWKMNPGKVLDSYGQTTNLRIGTTYNPPHLKTHFHYPEDGGNFAHATLRCVGVGDCRRHDKGTMCPSYMVTKEEEDSTRGRAHLLFEMMQGEEITTLWKSKEVKKSLDLCLSCKGCKGDCPVNVDMATYKSEFLSHYYKGKIRPRSAYAFGLIFQWARLASRMPAMANLFTQSTITSPFVKFFGGISQQSKIPRFAKETFKDWFNKRPARNTDKPKILLWPDTFNNYFLPETLQAATEVLEAAGFHVTIPKKNLCCGRPLYDYGMLNKAKSELRQILDALQDEIKNEIPIIGLEPSCVTVFRDELVSLFPDNENAKRLNKQMFTLSEFLQKKVPDFQIPHLNKKAIVHGHCHHKAIMKMDCDKMLLKRTGLNYEILDAGCCGMAGAFGYEAGAHHKLAVAAGERAFLPAIRKVEDTTIIVADGFSCREQIAQHTNRKGLHMAQVLKMALEYGTLPPVQTIVNNENNKGVQSTGKRKTFTSVSTLIKAVTTVALNKLFKRH